MVKKIVLFALWVSFVFPAFSQNELNAYKYVIVPKKYEFLKKENQFRLNSLTKHWFDKAGYLTLVKGEALPKEVLANPCLAVTANVINDSNLFTTKLKLTLNNCYDQVVYTSKQGTSKIKEYEDAYKEALQECFTSLEELNYKFDPNMVQGQSKAPEKVVAEAVAPASQTVPVEEKVIEPEPAKAAETKAAAVPVAVAVAPGPEKETVSEPEQAAVTEPKAALVPVAVPVAQAPVSEKETKTETTIARSYRNENIAFFLIEQDNSLKAYVSESNIEAYKKGEMIGTFEKTSLPNVYRVAWKKKQQDIDQTTAYFDDEGNLKIDIHRNGKIEVVTFEQEK
jgi:hypothetical protein